MSLQETRKEQEGQSPLWGEKKKVEFPRARDFMLRHSEGEIHVGKI